MFEKLLAPVAVEADLCAELPEGSAVADEAELGRSAVSASLRHSTCLA